MCKQFWRYAFIILFFLIYFGSSISVVAQTKTLADEILGLSESFYRSDDRLLNGKYYVPKHYFAEGHPYLYSKDWIIGNLYIKGIQYENVTIKYNIEDDKIILKAVYENRISKDILMHNTFIDSLSIGSTMFHNTSNLYKENAIGIAELISRGKYMAYFKHSIEFKDELSERYRYGKYLKAKKKLYIFDGSKFIPIIASKDLVSLFPDSENDILAFMRKNGIRFKKASSNQISILMNYCENL